MTSKREQAHAPADGPMPDSHVERVDNHALGQVGNYAELHGGEGRDVFFRPDRYHRSQLGPIGVTVAVTIGERVHRSDLFDVSQNGVAFAWPPDQSLEIGMTLSELVVSFDRHEAYRGAARVSSLRRTDEGIIVGASFVDTLMNIEDVLQLRDVKAWTGGAGSPGLGVLQAPWRVNGQERFKAAVADLRLFLDDSRQKLSELESSLPWAVAHGENDSPARDALIERVRSEFASDVVSFSAELDTGLRAASRAEREPLREFSVRYLHDLLMQAPWMHRARHKPLGYPGDFEVMNYVYDNRFSGSTLFAKALSLSFLCTPAGEAVRTRKNLIKARLSALCDDTSSDRPLRVLSIAAGPAQEIFELLAERTQLGRPLEIVLFDQDKRALSYSYGRLRRLVGSKWRDQVQIFHLHDSIKRLLRGGASVFSGHGAFDAVYSCGLFDYLQVLTAVSLCKSLYALVAPGGTLYVGNMVPANPSRWFMELHLDWFLVYRETAELLEIGRAAAPDARLELLSEETGVNPFIALTR